MNRLLVSLLALVLLSTGCSKLREAEIKDVSIKGFQLINTSSANIEIEFVMDNPSGKIIVLSDANGLLKRGESNFANFTLVKADTIAPKSVSAYKLTFKVEIMDPLSLLSMGLNVSKWQYSDFKVDARAVVKLSGGGRKVLKFKDVPLENIVKRL